MLVDFEKLQKPKKISNDEEIKHQLHEILESSVKKSVSGYQEIPVAFSGGIDSAILTYLASKYAQPVLFCVGFKNSYDVKNAKRSAKLLDLKLNIVYLDGLDLERYFNQTVEIIGSKNQMKVELNLPVLVLAERLRKNNFTDFIFGQGADELFGGYHKYLKSESLEGDLFNDVKNIYRTNLQYNFKVCDHFKIKPIYPFLEKEAAELAIKISPKLKIKNSVRKYILREAFKNDMPKEIINQNKKALQYGSGVHKALRKIKK